MNTDIPSDYTKRALAAVKAQGPKKGIRQRLICQIKQQAKATIAMLEVNDYPEAKPLIYYTDKKLFRQGVEHKCAYWVVLDVYDEIKIILTSNGLLFSSRWTNFYGFVELTRLEPVDTDLYTLPPHYLLDILSNLKKLEQSKGVNCE